MNIDSNIFSGAGITTTQQYDEDQLVVSEGEDNLDRTAFLKLLTTQLQNQNPLDPMKNEAFVAQLAQFSQLEGITNMSTSLADVASVMRSDRIMAGANLVGKSVFGASGTVTADNSSEIPIELELPYGADQVDIAIRDSATGALVHSMSVGPQVSGNLKLSWDGRLKDGSLAPQGTYSIDAQITQGGGSYAATPFTHSEIQSVTWNAQAGDLSLNLSGGVTMSVDQVSRIGQSRQMTDEAEQATELDASIQSLQLGE